MGNPYDVIEATFGERLDPLEAIASFRDSQPRARASYQDARVVPPSVMTPSLQGEQYTPNDFRRFTDDASARESVERTLRDIERALRQPGLADSERERLEGLAQQTVRDAIGGRGGGLFGKALDVLTRPLSGVVLALEDTFTDAKSVRSMLGFEVSDRDEITSSDYMAVLRGDYEDLEHLGEPLVGEYGRPFVSSLLSSAGWQPGGGLLNRVARGLVAFTGDVALDPTTYITFGGAGVGAMTRGAAAGRALDAVGQAAIERELTKYALEEVAESATSTALKGTQFFDEFVDTMSKQTDDALRTVLNRAGTIDGRLTPAVEAFIDGTLQADEFFARAATLTDDVTAAALRRETITEAAEQTKAIIARDTLVPSVGRDFGAMRPSFVDLRKVQVGGKPVLPAYTVGGIRIGSPFGGRGVLIPHTRGLGHRLTGEQALKALDALGERRFGAMLERWLAKGGSMKRRLGSDHLYKRLIRDEGYNWLRASKVLDQIEQPMRLFTTRLAASAANLYEEAARHGANGDDLMREVMNLLDRGLEALDDGSVVALRVEAGLTPNIGDSPELTQAVLETARTFRQIDQALFGMASQYRNMGTIENYVPHLISNKGRKVIELVATHDGLTFQGDDVASELLESLIGNFGVKTAAGEVGDSFALHARTFGKGLVYTFPLGTDSLALVARQAVGQAGMAPQFATVQALNEALLRALRDLDSRHGLGLRTLLDADGFGVFEDNAARAYGAYLESLMETVRLYGAADAVQRFGMAEIRKLGRGLEVDIPRTVSNIVDRWTLLDPERGIPSIGETVTALLLRATENPLGAMKKIRVAGTSLEVPAVVAAHPEFKALRNQVTTLYRQARTSATKFNQERRAYKARLRAEGYSDTLAEALSYGTHAELLATRRKLQTIRREIKGALEKRIHAVHAALGEEVTVNAEHALADIAQLDAALREQADRLVSEFHEIVGQGSGTRPSPAIIKEMTEHDLAMLHDTIAQYLGREGREALADAQRDQVAAMYRAIDRDGIPVYDGDGHLTEFGVEMRQAERRLAQLEAGADPDTGAALKLYLQEVADSDTLIARRAAVHILEDLEAAGVLRTQAGTIVWPAADVGGVKVSSAEVTRIMQDAFEDIRDFESAFWEQPFLWDAVARQTRRGQAMISTEEWAEPLVDLSGTTLDPWDLGTVGEREVLGSREYLDEMAARKSAFNEQMRGYKRGRPPEFHSVPEGGEGALMEYRLLLYRAAAESRRREIFEYWFDSLSSEWEDSVLADYWRPRQHPLRTIRQGDYAALPSVIAHTDPRVWRYYSEVLHDAGVPPNIELRPLFDQVQGRHRLVMVDREVLVGPLDEVGVAEAYQRLHRGPHYVRTLYDKIDPKEGGGFTYNPLTGAIVEAGDDLRVYALAPFERVLDQTDRVSMFRHIDAYMEEHRAQLEQPGHYLGLWAEPLPDGSMRVTLDISVSTPSWADAWQFATEENQAAIWDALANRTYFLNTKKSQAYNHGQKRWAQPPAPTERGPNALPASPHRAEAEALAAHPDLHSTLTAYYTIEDRLTVARAETAALTPGLSAAERRRLTTELAQLEAAHAAVLPAILRSLKGKVPSDRVVLRDTLFTVNPKGKRVLSAEGRTLQRALAPNTWADLRAHAEYLAAVGELEVAKRVPSTVVRAVRHAHEFQLSAANMFNPDEAVAGLQQEARALTAQLTDAQNETARMMLDLIETVQSWRRYGALEGGPDEGLAIGETVFGRDGSREILLEELKNTRGLVDELAKRRVRITKEDGRIVERAALTKRQAAALRKVLQPTLTTAGMPEGSWVSLSTLGIDSGALRNQIAHPAVAEWFAAYIDTTQNMFKPGAILDLQRGTQQIMRWWRRTVTIGRPIPFNTRNLIGGLWNNTLVGLSPLDPIYRDVALNGIRFDRVLWRTGDLHAALDAVSPKMRPYFEAAYKEEGVLETYARTQLHDALHGLAPLRTAQGLKQGLNPLHPGFAVNRLGGRVMASTEAFMRMAAFVKHYNPADPSTGKVAAALVRAVHFDYSDLTTVERNIQRFIPFWVWTKRNFELQLRVAVERPEMVVRYWKLQQNLAANFGGGPDDRYDTFGTPEWWSPYAAPTDMFLRKDSPYWGRLFMDPDLPVGDLLDMPLFGDEGLSLPALFAWVGNSFGPQVDLLRAIIEPDPGYDTTAGFGLAQVLQLWQWMTPLASTSTQDGTVQVNPHIQSLFDTALPWMRNLIEPIVEPPNARRAQRLGYAPEDDGVGARARAWLLEQGRGLGLKLQTPAEQSSQDYLRGQEAQSILEALKVRGGYIDPKVADNLALNRLMSEAFGR